MWPCQHLLEPTPAFIHNIKWVRVPQINFLWKIPPFCLFCPCSVLGSLVAWGCAPERGTTVCPLIISLSHSFCGPLPWFPWLIHFPDSRDTGMLPISPVEADSIFSVPSWIFLQVPFLLCLETEVEGLEQYQRCEILLAFEELFMFFWAPKRIIPRSLCSSLPQDHTWVLPSSSTPVSSCSGLSFNQLLTLASTSLPCPHCFKLKGFPLKEGEIPILLLFSLLLSQFHALLLLWLIWWKFLTQQVEFEWSYFNAGTTLPPPVQGKLVMVTVLELFHSPVPWEFLDG